MREIILASKSPRRLEILKNHGITPVVMPTFDDEIVDQTLSPEEIASSIAISKARSCYKALDKENHKDAIIIAADTIVYKDKILGKPKDRDDAKIMLKSIRNTEHIVCTGVAFIDTLDGSEYLVADTTKVYCKNYTDEDIENYLDTDEPYDKAGAYAIQGIFGKYIQKYEGDYENVVGLPWHKVEEYLDTL